VKMIKQVWRRALLFYSTAISVVWCCGCDQSSNLTPDFSETVAQVSIEALAGSYVGLNAQGDTYVRLMIDDEGVGYMAYSYRLGGTNFGAWKVSCEIEDNNSLTISSAEFSGRWSFSGQVSTYSVMTGYQSAIVLTELGLEYRNRWVLLKEKEVLRLNEDTRQVVEALRAR